nr:transposase [Ktedonobacter racemifer]
MKVDPRYTSQICSGCGTVRQKTLSEQWHLCECGCELDHDHNAARNVKRLWLGTIRKRNPPEKPPHVCVGSRHKTITYSLPIVEGVAR